MKAVIVHGKNDLRVEEIEDPVCGGGGVLVEMEWGGICGSDVSYWKKRCLRHRHPQGSAGPRPRGGRPRGRNRPGRGRGARGARGRGRHTGDDPPRDLGRRVRGPARRSPSAPTCGRRSATSVRRRSSRMNRADSAGSARCARISCGSCPRTCRRRRPRSPNRLASRCTRSRGPETWPAGLYWSTAAVRSVPWPSPRPNQPALNAWSPPTSPTPPSTSPAGWERTRR